MVREYTAQTTAPELARTLAGEIQGKVVVVTGVTPGSIGATFAQSIAAVQPSLVILAGRNTRALQELADRIVPAAAAAAAAVERQPPQVQLRLLQLDLASLAAVRRSAAEIMAWADVPHIDVLVNNAGIMAADWALSVDGYESQLATNHLGPFLFTNLIMDKLLAAKSPRIVNVSSDGHALNPIRFADWNFKEGENYNKWHAYGQSKTANILMSIALAEKLGAKSSGLLAFSLHPGVIRNTGLSTHINWEEDFQTLLAVHRAWGNEEGWMTAFQVKTPEEGAATHVYAAFEPTLRERNGAYLLDSRVADPVKDTLKSWATSRVEAEKLWKLSERLVGQEFNY